MSAHHGGKGDSPRPVDPKKYGENYDRIFRKTHEVRHELKDRDGKIVAYAFTIEKIKP